MHQKSTSIYGDRFKDEYDKVYQDFLPPESQIEKLKKLASNGEVLEVGIGTGRVALPLSYSGVSVTGIDPSEQMLNSLHKKDSARKIKTYLGELKKFAAKKTHDYNLIYIVFNTFFLLSHEDKRNFFKHCHNILTRDGKILIETFVPHPNRRLADGQQAFFPDGKHLEVRSVDSDEVSLFVSENNQTEQKWTLNEITLRAGEPVHIIPATIRYLTPDQIDDLAQQSKFKLSSRQSDWSGSPFNADSIKHISVYERNYT